MLSCAIFSLLSYASQAEVINSIDVQGLKLVSLETVSSQLTLSVGQDITLEDLNDQITILYATGLFKQVEMSVEDNILIVKCTEQPVIRNIEVEDLNGVLPEDQVKKQLENAGIIKAELLDEVALEEFRVMSQYSLRQYGFANAEIETSIEEHEGSVATLHAVIHEGESTKLKSIKFEGDLIFPERELKRYLSSQTTGIASFYFMDDLYSEQRLNHDRDSLVQFYQSKGYLAPSVQLQIEEVQPFQRMWSSNYKAATFVVDPGPKFYVDTVKFDNAIDEWPEILKDAVMSKVNGKVLDSRLMGSLKESLMEYYKDEPLRNFYQIEIKHEIRGYDKVHINLNLNKTISKVRYISFYGNRSTYDEPMRRALQIQESKPFNIATLRQTERSLRGLGYLKDVTITPVKVGENLYDVNIEIKEASTLQADMKAEYGNGGISATISASDPNAFGTGNSAAINISGGLSRQQISASYIQPNYTLSGHKLSNVMSYTRQSKSNKDEVAYHVDSFNYILGYSIPLSNHMMVDFAGAVLYDQYYGVDRAASIVEDFFVGRNTLVKQYKASAGLSYQDIDSAYMPTHGIVLCANSSITLPHKDSITYLQMIGEAKTYYPLGTVFEQPLVLRTRMLAQVITDYSNENRDIAFFARYHAGGLGTVRGYSGLGPTYLNEKRVQPLDDPDGPKVVISQEIAVKGGNKLLLGSMELQLPSPSPDFVTPYLFMDAGNVFDDSENISFSEMRGSAGLSVTGRLPIGTMTASIAMPFNNKSGDDFKFFSFGMGVSF